MNDVKILQFSSRFCFHSGLAIIYTCRSIVEQLARRCGVGEFDYLVALDPSTKLNQLFAKECRGTSLAPTVRAGSALVTVR